MSDKTKFSRWDTTEILETQEDIDIYLEIAFESNDPKLIAKALGNVARARGMLNIANEPKVNLAV